MSLPLNWVQAPAAKALGLTLAHFVWEGAAIGLVLAAVLRRAGRRSTLRYTLACLAMAAMVVSFGLTLAHFRPAALAGQAVALRSLSAAGGVGAGPTVPAEPAAGLAERLVWVVPFWAAGVLVFYLHGIGGWIVARRLRRTGVTPAPGDWQARLGRLRQRLRVSRPVALMESCLAEAPVVIGFLRPVILLPIGLLTGPWRAAGGSYFDSRIGARPAVRLPGEPDSEVRRGSAVLSPGGLVGVGPDPRGA